MSRRKTLEKYYPGALSMKELLHETLKASKYGVKPKNTLLCSCTCVDELSNSIEEALQPTWDWSFWLSGLAGLPFTGSTGWAAGLSHVPDKYDQRFMFVIYGPHIGITDDGVVGAVERRGMKEPSTCCGALIGALRSPNYKPGDNQQNYIVDIVNDNSSEIGDSIVRLTDVVYQQLVTDLFALIHQNFKMPVVLLGGINVNTDHGNYFKVRNYQIVYPNGKIIELRSKPGSFHF